MRIRRQKYRRGLAQDCMFTQASGTALYIGVKLAQYNTIHDTIRYDTIRYDTIRYDTIRYDTIRYDTIRYDTIRYDTIRYDTIQCNAMQCNTMQCNAMQCITMQYIIKDGGTYPQCRCCNGGISVNRAGFQCCTIFFLFLRSSALTTSKPELS